MKQKGRKDRQGLSYHTCLKGPPPKTKVIHEEGTVRYERSIEQFLPMIIRLARKYSRCIPRGLSVEDLIGEGLIAVNRCVVKGEYKSLPDKAFYPYVYVAAQRQISTFIRSRSRDQIWSVEDYQDLYDDSDFEAKLPQEPAPDCPMASDIAVVLSKVESCLGRQLTSTDRRILRSVLSGSAERFSCNERLRKSALKDSGSSVNVSKKVAPNMTEIAKVVGCSTSAVSNFFSRLREHTELFSLLGAVSR